MAVRISPALALILSAGLPGLPYGCTPCCFHAQVSGEQGLSREEFMAHPYFESMDWELLARKGIPIPQ